MFYVFLCSDVMGLSNMKEYMYLSLSSPGSVSEKLEGKLNVMHTTYLILQASSDILDLARCEAKRVFKSLNEQHLIESISSCEAS